MNIEDLISFQKRYKHFIDDVKSKMSMYEFIIANKYFNDIIRLRKSYDYDDFVFFILAFDDKKRLVEK